MPTLKYDKSLYAQYLSTAPSNDLQPLALDHENRGKYQTAYGVVSLCLCLLPITGIAARFSYVHYQKAKAIRAEMESRGLEAIRGQRWEEVSPVWQELWLKDTDQTPLNLEGLEDLARRGYPIHRITYFNTALVEQALINVESEKPAREARRIAYEQRITCREEK